MLPKKIEMDEFRLNVVKDFMIPRSDIPKDYPHRKFFEDLQSKWFFQGLAKSDFPKPKDGIDFTMALQHLQVVQQSFDSKHEHKQECVAYLMSLWFQGPETVVTAKNNKKKNK